MNEEEMLDIIDRIIRYNSLTYFGYNTAQEGYVALEKIVKQYKKQQKEIENLRKTNKILFEQGQQNAIQELLSEKYIRKDKIKEKNKRMGCKYKMG